MKYIPFILFFALFSLSCKKKVQAPLSEFDSGCECANEVSAAFSIDEMSGPYIEDALYTETDTAYTKKNVRFKAVEKNADYTWYIGAEVIHDSVVYRYFDETLNGQTIPITLVIHKNPNSICFPNDDGYDSITKYITFVDKGFDMSQTSYFSAPQPNYEGTYRLLANDATDSVDVTLDFVQHIPGVGYDGYINLVCPEDNRISRYLINFKWNYKEILGLSSGPYNWSDSFYYYGENIIRNSNDDVRISLTQESNTTPHILSKIVYKGRKL